MRWFDLAVIIVFAAATLLFILQNGDLVTMSFFGLSFPLTFRNPYCHCLRSWSCDGWQPICAAAPFLPRLAAPSVVGQMSVYGTSLHSLRRNRLSAVGVTADK